MKTHTNKTRKTTRVDGKIDAHNKIASTLKSVSGLSQCIETSTMLLRSEDITDRQRKKVLKQLDDVGAILNEVSTCSSPVLNQISPIANLTYAQKRNSPLKGSRPNSCPIQQCRCRPLPDHLAHDLHDPQLVTEEPKHPHGLHVIPTPTREPVVVHELLRDDPQSFSP